MKALSCAQNRNRTCTPLPKQDFESSASTNSAIWAIFYKTFPRQLRDANVENLFLICKINFNYLQKILA